MTPDGTLLVECYRSITGRRLPPRRGAHVAANLPVAGRIVPAHACVSANGSMLAFATCESRLGEMFAFVRAIARS